ncbi:MAG: recombination protein O N-terminal domain-containing protein [Patescibacteria group bacterium]
MQHKYVTRAVVLSRAPVKEVGAVVTLLTQDLGLVRARAEGLRRSGAKLAHALQTLSEVELTVLRGKEGWRLSGAVLVEPWFQKLSPAARTRAGKRASLILRLVQGETVDAQLYDTFIGFLNELATGGDTEQDRAELFATLKILSILGHDDGPFPSAEEVKALAKEERLALISRINRGLEASGL